MTNLNSLIQVYKKKFILADIPHPLNEIRYIINESIGLSNLDQIFNGSEIITKETEANIVKNLEKRIKRMPSPRIFQKSYFRDLSLDLCNENFIPRIDSEIIIESIIQSELKMRNILEIGTGSGALVISLLKAFKDCKAVATDISYEAIYMAKKNSIINNVNNRLQLICCNWLDVFKKIDFDVVVSNPPYIESNKISKLDPEVKNHDPLRALDGGVDGLDGYREMLSKIKLRASAGLVVVFEIGYDQAEKVSSLMHKNNISLLNIFKDYNNKDRCIVGIKKK